MAEQKDSKKSPAVAAGPLEPSIDWGENLSEADIDGWHDPELTPIVIGQIVGFKVIETDNGPSDVVIVKMMQDIKAKGNRGETIELKVGQTLGVFVRSKLQPLLDYVEHKNVVRIQTLEKVPIKGGKTMWTFDIKAAKNSRIGAPPKNSVTAAMSNMPVVSKGRGKSVADDFFP